VDNNSQVGDGDVPVGGLSPNRISGTAWTSANQGAGSGLDADQLDGFHAGSFPRKYYEGTLSANTTTSIDIPHYTLFTLQLSSGWPGDGGLAFILGFENDSKIGITYTKYNGDGTGAAGGAEGDEGTTTTLVQFGQGSYIYKVKCPGETNSPHNLVLTATGVELRYRLIY
jgi:hypothetical protein